MTLPLTACGGPAFRNYSLPETLAPVGSEVTAGEVQLDASNSELMPGGIRLVEADLAAGAPPFELPDQSGTVHTNETLRGRVVWIDLWADWCATCRAEFPRVQSLHERYDPNGLTILAVCRNSSPAGYRQAVEKDWIQFRTVDAGEIEDFPFPYAAFPTSVVIDRAGRIRAYWRGHRDGDALEGLLRRLLAEPAGGSSPLADTSRPVGLPLTTPPQIRRSDEVVAADLEIARRDVAAGGFFQGSVVLDVDPGWHLTAERERGLVPLAVRLADSTGVRSFDRLVPSAGSERVAGERRDVHLGRVEVPVWGTITADWPAGRPLTLEIVATVQACDATLCLAPVDLVLTEDLWIGSPEAR